MKKAKKIAEYAPATCTFDQLLKIGRDNISIGDYAILTDARTVWLCQQAMGEKPTQTFGIPRARFNKLIRWYLKPQKRVTHS